jgi:tetratricopeptide (TPR) repeat protein
MSEKAFEISQLRTTIDNLPYKTYDKNNTISFTEVELSDTAIEKVESNAKKNIMYDLVVLSRTMKRGFSGMKTASVIHSKKWLKPPPMIMLVTDHVEKDTLKHGAKIGQAFLHLPYTQNDFQHCLTSLTDNMIKTLETNRNNAIKSFAEKGSTIDSTDFISTLNGAIIRELGPIKALAPWNKKPYISLSNFLMEEGDYKTPIPILRSAILINFAGQEPHRLLKKCYQKTGMHKEEVGELKKLLEANPGSAKLNAQFGEALLRTRDYKNAVEFFKKAITNHKPQDPARLKAKAHWGVGKSIIGISDDDETRKIASEEFNKAITVDPTLVLAYFNLISVYKKLGMEEQAREVMKKAIKITPESAKDWVDLFFFYLEDGETAKAKVAVEKARKIDPENPLIPFLAGEAYLRNRMFKEAIDYFEKSVKLYPSDIRFYNSLGICYRHLKVPERSIENYQKALEIDPKDHNVHYNLGKAYHSVKDLSKARKSYEKALQLKEDFAEAKQSILDIEKDEPKVPKK